jgi:capsular exopolysaccharide synthesis family protein
MSEKFRDDWPAMKDLRGELRQARERLDLETGNIARQVGEIARTEFLCAQAEVTHLEKQLERQKLEVQRVNRDAIEYASLKAEIATKSEMRADLVSRQSETQISERLKDTQTSNIHVVDPAEVPRFAVWPKWKLNMVLAVVLGTALSVGIASWFDYLDNTVKREQDIVRVASIAVLGHVPLHQPLQVIEDGEVDTPPVPPIDLASYHAPHSPFSEAFRNLRTSLLLASPEHPPVRILVTSCEPQDGKSTISANLALVLTQLGRRVLLVDADLRKPRLHRAFGLSNDVGLSNVLSGNAKPREILCETELPNLMVATSGPIPPNPSELLGSAGLQAFLTQVDHAGCFDHIVVDSPPVVSVTDPVVLASKLDATIIVVRAGKTARESLSHTVERLRQSRGRILGAVLNATSQETGHYYSGYHHHHRCDRDGTPEPASQSSRGFFRRHRDQRRARGARQSGRGGRQRRASIRNHAR